MQTLPLSTLLHYHTYNTKNTGKCTFRGTFSSHHRFKYAIRVGKLKIERGSDLNCVFLWSKRNGKKDEFFFVDRKTGKSLLQASAGVHYRDLFLPQFLRSSAVWLRQTIQFMWAVRKIVECYKLFLNLIFLFASVLLHTTEKRGSRIRHGQQKSNRWRLWSHSSTNKLAFISINSTFTF